MLTAPLDTPRSRRRPDLPVVFPFGETVYFPDGCDGYGLSFEQLRDEFDRLLYHLEEKRWWTPAHETALRCILDMNGSSDEPEGCEYED
jgi:hypothetical protein